MNDRFTYHAGDIQIKKSQCEFCKYNERDENEPVCTKCPMYPDGKPDEILRTRIRCPFLKFK